MSSPFKSRRAQVKCMLALIELYRRG